ncbi:hypothetical protein [Desulfovibrio sp. UCD-KL4C]|uniref:hypothetical protein n=1 Tax=Desulfovibrio sp. UCD-KL4C TaxID=2578120 RepID=UPI0025B9B22D|nr:hypothetical protein [Desulfovibrio sp. UCD-KL4C]
MKSILTFIGGVAVGILAVTGIYALEDEKVKEDCDESEDLNTEIEDEKDKDPFIVNAS